MKIWMQYTYGHILQELSTESRLYYVNTTKTFVWPSLFKKEKRTTKKSEKKVKFLKFHFNYKRFRKKQLIITGVASGCTFVSVPKRNFHAFVQWCIGQSKSTLQLI